MPMAFFGIQKKPGKIWLSGFFQSERLGSGKRVHRILQRFAVNLKMTNVIGKKQMYDSVSE